jgi:hypothetical protein
MHKHRTPEDNFLTEKEVIFNRVLAVLDTQIFPDPPTARIPTAVLEAALVGLAINIDHVEALNAAEVRQRYTTLRAHDAFNEEAVAEGLSKKDKVDKRFDVANEIFSVV